MRILLVESRIEVPLTKTGIQYLEFGIHGADPESKTSLDSLAWARMVYYLYIN